MILLPATCVDWMNLHRAGFAGAPEFIGLASHRALVADPVFWRAGWNTFLMGNAVVYGELLLGPGFALFAVGRMPCRRTFIALLTAPYAVNEVSAMAMWRFALEPDGGMANWALMRAGIGQLAWSAGPNDALLLASTILSIWMHTPFAFLILCAALLGVPRELEEAALVGGAGPALSRCKGEGWGEGSLTSVGPARFGRHRTAPLTR